MSQMTPALSPLQDFLPKETIAKTRTMRIPESHHSFLNDKKRSEMFLELHLEGLKATHLQHIQQIELQHQADLEKRMLQNSLLSAHTEYALKTNRTQENPREDRNSSKSRGGAYMFDSSKRSSSTPDLRRQNPSNPKQAWTSTASVTRYRRKELPQTKTPDKEEIDWAECQKQFRVAPVPEHVFKALYDDIVSEQERARQEGRQQRKEFLLAMQKPFTFHPREERRRDRLKQETASSKQSENSKHVGGRKPIPKAVTDPSVSKRLKEEEQQRRIRIQARAQETLRASSAPFQSQAPRADEQQRTAQRTMNRVLGFMEQRPSFRPKTTAKVPDFDKLYQTFQREIMERAEKREVTLCQPFKLRTSTLQPRPSRTGPEEPLKSTSKSFLRRTNSFGGLTSLSMDTLPTYITDATRKRSMAIRKSLELRESKEQEPAEIMRQHRMNSQAMSRAVAARAKAMDPHKSLKEVYQEKLRQHKQADQEREKDYKRELKEMRARVVARPYLFEQVLQKNAKCDAERRYRSTLEQVGLNESFVRSKGESGVSQTSKNKDDDSDDGDHESLDTDTQQRKGSGEDSTQNEDGKEESVKTDDE